MSALHLGRKVGLGPKEVYNIWNEMGLVQKDKWGDWTLTILGREMGGRMSDGTRLSVPTFDFDTILNPMIEFVKRKKNA